MTSLSFHFATILTLVHLWSLRLTRSIRRTVKVLSSSRSTGRRDVSMYESNTIATIRSVLDCIMGSTRDKQDILSKAIIEREERDENDLEYVFIRQPRKRRDNFKEEERSKIALAATTKALQDASKADFEMNLDLKDVANCRRNVQDSNASSRHSTANEKINVLSLCRSSRVHGFGGDFSNRKTVRFLPLPLNAPESSSLSVHAFAKVSM